MNDFYQNKLAEDSPKHYQQRDETGEEKEFKELRSLLIGIEAHKLEEICQRIDDFKVTPEEISKALPEATVLRSQQDNLLGEAMISTVEEAIQGSIKKDINILSETIFPLIGPATRKSVSAALDEMVQSFNQALEHSLSPQSFKWRLEAKRTGKSFAEIILLRTLLYRVEQIFLIHKQSGLLLQHIVASQVSAQDPDLVSAMLTAIQDFVKDSFSVRQSDGLQSLEFGELTIWIQEGPSAVIAGIIRGNAPLDLRSVFQDAVEKIHFKANSLLRNFNGDTEPFESVKPYLEACLESQYKTQKTSNYNLLWSFVTGVGIITSIWTFFTIKEQLRWNAFLSKLKSEPGLVILESKKEQGKYFISGMRDPLGKDINSFLKENNFQPQEVITQWKPYISLEPQLITKRAYLQLKPPKTVSLEVDENGVLYATGSAPQQWILDMRKQVAMISGISKYDDTKLDNFDVNQLQSYQNKIEESILLFSEGTSDLLPGEDVKLKAQSLNIQKILEIATFLNKELHIKIIGHTNSTGGEKRNMILSQSRAKKVFSYMTSDGIDSRIFKVIGVAASEQINPESLKNNNESNRRVSFKILLNDLQKGKSIN
jgi:outer membrane protein OmpA-like peptidoglycan-associated protein